MDIGTVIGLVLAFGAILGSILVGGDIMSFVDVPSVIVVIFGMIGSTFIKWPMEVVKNVVSIGMKALFFTPADPKETIDEIGNLAETARRESVFALEKQPIDDPFMKKAMTLAADNRPPEVISSILQLEIDAMEERHKVGAEIFSGMAEDGPAFGMIGTLIGLVIMLGNMGGDPSSIGEGMAVALITTLYGVLLANLFLKPAAKKLEQKFSIMRYRDRILMEGISMLPNKPHPYTIQDHLNRYLDPSNHFDIAER